MAQHRTRLPHRQRNNYFVNMDPEVLKHVAQFYIDILRPPSQSGQHDSEVEYDHRGFMITRPTAEPSRLLELE